MTIPISLSDLQNEYDAMVGIATDCLNADIPLHPDFEAELIRLMRVVKELGGRVY